MYAETAFKMLEKHGFAVNRQSLSHAFTRGDVRIDFRVSSYSGHICGAQLNNGGLHPRPSDCLRLFIAATRYRVEEVEVEPGRTISVSRGVYPDQLVPYVCVREKHGGPLVFEAELSESEEKMPTKVLVDWLQDEKGLVL